MRAHRHANPTIDGAKVRELRQAAGLTVTQAARRIGVTTSYLSAIELGRRRTVTPARFNQICALLGVEREVLLGQQLSKAAA